MTDTPFEPGSVLVDVSRETAGSPSYCVRCKDRPRAPKRNLCQECIDSPAPGPCARCHAAPRNGKEAYCKPCRLAINAENRAKGPRKERDRLNSMDRRLRTGPLPTTHEQTLTWVARAQAAGWSKAQTARWLGMDERTVGALRREARDEPERDPDPIPVEELEELPLRAVIDCPEGYRLFFETYSPYTPVAKPGGKPRKPSTFGMAAHNWRMIEAAYHYCKAHAHIKEHGGDLTALAWGSFSLPPPGCGQCECGWESLVIENIGPRFAKSEHWSNWFILWRFAVDRTVRVILISKATNLMQQFVGYISTTWQTNHDLIFAYGRFKPVDDAMAVWKLSEGELDVEGRDIELKERSLRAKGSGGTLPGLAADWIIVDDAHNDKNSATEFQRDELERWFTRDCFSRMAPGAHMFVIGMRYDDDDLYGRLLQARAYDEEYEDIPGGEENRGAWKHISFPALYDPETGEASLARDAVSLWPEEWPAHILRGKRNATRIGPVEFDTNYQQMPRSPDSLVFDPELIYGTKGMFTEEIAIDGKRYKGCLDLDRGIGEAAWPREQCVRVASADPSKSNFSALSLVDIHKSAPRFRMAIIDIENLKMHGVGQYKSNLLATLRKWLTIGPIDVLLHEENNFQEWASIDPDVVALCRDNRIRITGHSTYGNKGDPELGFEQLANLLWAADLRFPHRATDLEARMLTRKWADEAKSYRSDTSSRSRRTDKLMSAWFIYHAQKKLYRKRAEPTGQEPKSRYPVRGYVQGFGRAWGQ